MPPEWSDTTNAPPAGGMLSRFRTSARYHRLTSGPTAFLICSVNAGSHLRVSRLSATAPVMPFMVRPQALPLLFLLSVIDCRSDANLKPHWVCDIYYSQFRRMLYSFAADQPRIGGRCPKRFLSLGFGLVGSQTVRR